MLFPCVCCSVNTLRGYFCKSSGLLLSANKTPHASLLRDDQMSNIKLFQMTSVALKRCFRGGFALKGTTCLRTIADLTHTGPFGRHDQIPHHRASRRLPRKGQDEGKHEILLFAVTMDFPVLTRTVLLMTSKQSHRPSAHINVGSRRFSYRS